MPSGRHLKARWRYTRGSLCGLLRGGIYHTTSIESFTAIFESGAIEANDGQRFPSKYAPCYAHRQNCIALFDFIGPESSRAAEHEFKWSQFFLSETVPRITLKLSLNHIEPNLIRNHRPQAVLDQDGVTRQPKYVPSLEAWHPGPIAVASVDQVLIYDNASGCGFHSFLAGPTLVQRVLAKAAALSSRRPKRPDPYAWMTTAEQLREARERALRR